MSKPKNNSYRSPLAPGVSLSLPHYKGGGKGGITHGGGGPSGGSGGGKGGGSPTPGVTLGGDPGLMAAQDTAQLGGKLADLGANFATSQIGSKYGYGTDGQVDPNNPYGRAALALDSYRRSQRGIGTSYAAAGQFHSGAYGRAQEDATRQYQITDDQLKKGRQSEMGQVLLDWLNKKAGGQMDEGSATFQALLNSIGGK